MFKFRIIGFALLMALLGGIFFWKAGGAWLFIIAAPSLSAAAVGEFAGMLNNSGRKCFPVTAAVISWLIMVISLSAFQVACATETNDLMSALMYLTTLSVLLLPLVAFGGFLSMKSDVMERIINSYGVMSMLVPPLYALLLTYFVSSGGFWLLFICLVTKATDTGGYIVGTLTAKLPGGNHKIAPAVSPKKSWEGLIGGMILSVAVAWCFYRYGSETMPLVWTLISAVVLGLGSFFGDLTESAVKRMCNVKDSGSFVPGMGGAFDVLDSFLYNGMLFWILLWFKELAQ